MKVVPLGEIVQVKGGGTPRKSCPDFFGGQVPWVTPKDMKKWRISDSSVRLTLAGVENSPARIVEPGSVLVVVRSGVLKHTLPVALTTAAVTVNQDLKALTPTREANAAYLAHFIKWKQPTILGWVRATTADNFPIDKLLQLRVPLPPLDEQRRIAAILDQAEALRGRRLRALDLLEALPQSLFLNRFGSSTSPVYSVAEVALAERGSMRTGPFGSQLLHSEFVQEGVAVLGLDNVVRNQFRWEQRRYITEWKYEQLKRYTVLPGDVLISIMGTCGRCVVVPDNMPTAINTKHICAVTVDRTRVLPEYVRACFLWHPDSRRYLAQRAKGSIMDGLNMSIIKEMPLPVAPLDQQREFVGRLRNAELGHELAVRSYECTEHLIRALQQRAFTGTTRRLPPAASSSAACRP